MIFTSHPLNGRQQNTLLHFNIGGARGPTLGEIPYALAEINFEITKSEAC